MIIIKMVYTIKKLADIAGVSVRTLHYYDEAGLLQPQTRGSNGYRYYDEESIIKLQQILFFRELGFSLEDIKKIISSPDFDVIEALRSHRTLLQKKAERILRLIETVDKTIKTLIGEKNMKIHEYYEGFSEEQVEKYREEVRQRWGEKTLQESEEKVIKMGKQKFAQAQARGDELFKAIAENMSKGAESKEVQSLVAEWRQWLENFHHYSDEEVLGLGMEYSRNPEFAKFFHKYNKDLPEFLTKAVQFYCNQNK
jgi:MerR family transcriptional regulator, thiopeptide resistance regulator